MVVGEEQQYFFVIVEGISDVGSKNVVILDRPPSLLTPRRAGVSIHQHEQLCSVDLKPGDCEMVVDGGGHFSPALYRWFTRMSLLFSTHIALSRAEGSPIEHLSR